VEYANKIGLDVLGISEVKPYDYKELLNSEFPYSYNTNKRYGIGQAEFLVLSKYKIIKPEHISLDQFGNALRFTINIDDRPLVVYLVHTTAPISPELYRKRNEGFDILAKKINADKSSKIIMFGDLNITPFSWVYRRFQKATASKFYNVTKGHGLNFTWSYFGLFATQLDHIFASNSISTRKFKIDKKLNSDHSLIWADLDL
jgi:endonuclease/exonuclease/phosphatase (EEP) superfamily protein YafD